MSDINSNAYWDTRFIENWETYSGPNQSRFFARIALQHLPSWLISAIKRESLTLADWGCAQGDGTNEWANFVSSKQLTGVDFSSVAVAQATERYPAIRFVAENWLSNGATNQNNYDFVFSSNVMEHFHSPYDVLNTLSEKARKGVILALPYREMIRLEEHFFTFLADNIPFALRNHYRLIWSQVVDCRNIPNTHWAGDQIILVYADTEWTDSLGLTLNNCLVDHQDFISEKKQLNHALQERDEQIVQLNTTNNERERELQTNLLAMQNEVHKVEQLWLEKNSQREAKHAEEQTELRIKLDSLQLALLSTQQEKVDQVQIHAERVNLLNNQLEKSNKTNAEWMKITSNQQLGVNALLNSKYWKFTSILRKLTASKFDIENIHILITPLLIEIDASKQKELNKVEINEIKVMQKKILNNNGKAAMKSIQDLLSLYGEDFVRQAYLTLLDREPDLNGLDYYLNRLKNGNHKLDIIKQIKSSKEGKVFKSRLTGLKRAIRRYKVSRIPLLGWLRPTNDSVEAKLRIIENRLFENSYTQTNHLIESNLFSKIENLNQTILEKNSELETLKNTKQQDLTWEQFESQILAHRDSYKGIFIQELVIDWNVPLYQRPQHIATAFGRLGYLVIYKTANWGSGDNINGVRQVAPNVWMTSCWDANNISGAVHSIYSTAYFHQADDIPNKVKDGVVIYEYIDHIDPQISGEGETIEKLLKLQEWVFAGGADFVVASAKKLHAEAVEKTSAKKVILAPNGVDTRHYRNPIHQTTPLPENFINFKSKHKQIIGYFGALAPWLWYETIAGLVKRRPDLGFVFIGPDYYGGVEKLPKADNVLYLGVVDYKILPAYALQFDVCFIPFAPGEIAKTTSPLKLFEYFALEKPVVVTSEMAECVAFPEVFSGNSIATLSKAIDKAIAIKSDANFKKRLSKLADENDWDKRAKAMEATFNLLKLKKK